MPLGRPSITTPAALQLQMVQQTIANIRERFAATDAVITTLSASGTAAALQAASDLRVIRGQIQDILRRLLILETTGVDDLSVTFTAAEDMDAGTPVWASAEGVVSRLDPDDLALSSGYVGITAEATIQGDPVVVRLPGGVVDVPGSSFTVGRPLYAQLGGVTHSPAGNSLPVGVAIGTEQISVGYGFNVLGDETFDPTGQDDMAMTYGLRGSGSGGVLPVVTGEVPPVLVYLPDGNLLYGEVP